MGSDSSGKAVIASNVTVSCRLQDNGISKERTITKATRPQIKDLFRSLPNASVSE